MLEAFLKSINCVIIMGLLAGAGYWTASKGWYDQTATQLIARLVTFRPATFLQASPSGSRTTS
ncbi:MAG: hypothetical protein V8T46_03245 [Sutterella seckii]